MTPCSRKSVNRLLLVGLLLLGSVAIFAGWESDYQKGVKMYKRGKYNQALQEFLKAVEDKAEDCSGCLREGMRFFDYIPNYYLAECYYHLGQRDAALEYARRTLQMGVIKDKPGFFKHINERIQELSPEKTPPAPKETPPAPPPDQPVEPGVPGEPLSPGVSEELKGKVQHRLNQMRERVRESEKKVKRRPVLRKIVGEVKSALDRLRGDLESAETEEQVLSVDRELSMLTVRLQELKSKLEEGSRPLKPPDKKKEPTPPPARPPATAPGTKPAPAPADLLRTVREGFGSFFDGNYETALSKALQIGKDQKEYCYAEVLKGCVYYTQYLMKINRDEQLLSRAREAFRVGKETGCGDELLTERDFSPKLIHFYKNP